MDTIETKQDTNQRVAVIITDGKNALVGKSPQNMRKEFSCCDLMKGHVMEGETLEEAAKREVLEECGLNITNLTKVSDELKYSKGTTLTFYVSKMSNLPNPSSLECNSFFEYNGRQFPEIAQYLSIPLQELTTYLYKGLSKLIVANDVIDKVIDECGQESLVLEDGNVKPIEYFANLLKNKGNLDAEVKQVKKTLKVIQVNTPSPEEERKNIVKTIGPMLGLQIAVPRKTKASGYTIAIVQDGTDEVFIVWLKKGGQHRGGRKNEMNFQSYIKNQLEQNGECILHVSDNYGVKVDLDIVDVIDSAANHGTKGDMNRADTTVELRDGTIYGISQKKTNATYVCKIKKMLKDILFQSEKKLREYAKEHGLQPGDYMDIRITQRDLIDLCWFGTDIATGAAFIGDLEDIQGNNIQIERIIQNGDEDVLTSFPIYIKWRIENKAYTMAIQGVCVPSLERKWVIDDLELPGINAPMPEGKKFRVGQEEEPKKKRRRKRRRKITEDIVTEDQLIEEARQNDMWDTIALCAENHKLVWLKYETVDEGEIISRRVAPYSYRTRNTKTRGRSTYFYAEDYTPGEDKQIKCFLVENCLQVKESNKSFTPRFPVEIKQEIDKLEQKRKEEEEKKEREEKKGTEIERPDTNDDIVNTDNDIEDEIKKKDQIKHEKPTMSHQDKKQDIKLPKKSDVKKSNINNIEDDADIDKVEQQGKDAAKNDLVDIKDGQVTSVTDADGNELEDNK